MRVGIHHRSRKTAAAAFVWCWYPPLLARSARGAANQDSLGGSFEPRPSFRRHGPAAAALFEFHPRHPRAGVKDCELATSFRGDAQHRTRNLEIPGLVLRTIPE